MQGRRYIDPFHFSPPDRAYQAGKTAGLLLPLLSARQEPPKEQECPKSRPEPCNGQMNENRQIIFHAGKNGYPPQKSRPRHLKTSDAPFFK